MSTFQPPSSSQKLGSFTLGSFNNVDYIRYKGKFVGQTNCGAFAVPYEITTPANPQEGNRTFVVEPPHFASGFVARDGCLGASFLYDNGFSHASVGYSNFRGHILDGNPGFKPKICGKEFPIPTPVTDYNIFEELALALRQNPPAFVGKVARVYCLGVSDSGGTVHKIYKPFGHKRFDITFACLAEYFAPEIIPGQKPIFVFNTEADFDTKAVPNPAFPQYRWYGVPGGAHIPDSALARILSPDPPKPTVPPAPPPRPPVAGTSPINWLLFLRALFLAGDRWVRNGVLPPASATLKLNAQGNIARDAKLNALGGIRHPALESEEATFMASVVRGSGWELFGGYGNPRRLGPAEFPVYLNKFTKDTNALLAAGYLLPQGRDRILGEAQLKQGNTYTLNYMEGLFFPWLR